MIAEDELSDMEISDDDNGDAHKMNFVNHFVDDDDEDDDDIKMLSMIKQAPLIWSLCEEFDTSDARLVEVDGQKLKKKDLYHTLVNFSYDCRRKIILEKFSCAGSQKDVCGGIASWEGKRLKRYHPECLKFARKAIAKYNRVNKITYSVSCHGTAFAS